MTNRIELSDADRETIARRIDLDKADWLKAAVDATIAHLNAKQEPDRFLIMARAACAAFEDECGIHEMADAYRIGEHDRYLGAAVAYLREQWEADRADLLERILGRFTALEVGTNSVVARIREEFAK